MPGRVAGPDDVDVAVAVGEDLRQGSTVVDADAGQPLDAGRLELPVLDAGGDEERPAAELAPVGERHEARLVGDPQPADLLGRQQLRAEAARLGHGAPRQVGPAEADREAKVVLDPRALARLPTRRLPLEQQRLEALRGAVDGGGQASRPAADDDEVVEGLLGAGAEADPLGDLDVGRLRQGRAVGEDDHRQASAGGALAAHRLDQTAALLVGLDVEPAVGDLVARQELADLVGTGRPAVADDTDPLERRPEGGQPVVEQVGEDRVELLLRRVPRLHQVLVEADRVDRPDGDLGVRVGGQEDPLYVREELDRLGQKVDAGHAGHALVHDQEGDRFAAEGDLAERLESGGARVGGQDTIVAAVLPPEIALHGA